MITSDFEGNILSWNAGAQRLYGYTAEEIIGDSIDRILPGHDTKAVRNRARGSSFKDQFLEVEAQHQHKSGEIFLADIAQSAWRGPAGEPVGVITSVRGVSKGRRREARYRKIFETSPDGIVFVGADKRLVEPNQAFLDLLGYTSEELEHLTYEQITPRKWGEIETERNRLLFETGIPQEYEKEYIRKDGAVFPISVRIWLVEGIVHDDVQLLARVQDISDRKGAEQKLKASEERFHQLAQLAPVGVFLTDREGGCLFVNDKWCEISGLTLEESLGKGWRQGIHPDDRDDVFRCWLAFARNEAPFDLEYRIETSKGVTTWVQSQAARQTDADGNLTGYIGALIDITDRKQAERKQRETQAQLKAIIDQMMDGVFTINEKGIVESANTACATIFGHGKSDVIGQNISMLMTGADRRNHDKYLSNYAKTGVAKIIGVGRVVDCLRADGSIFPAELTVTEITVDGHKKFVGVVRDITIREKNEYVQRERAVILDNIDYAVTAADQEGIITGWYSGAEKVFGWSEEEAVGQHLEIILPEDEIANWRREFRGGATANGTVTVETRRRRKDGGIFDAEVTVSKVKGAADGADQYIGVIRDITAQKQAERLLAEAKEQAEVANRAKSDFLSSMSHELRTPLNAVLGYGQILQLDQEHALNPRQRMAVHHIVAGGEQLLSLIEMVLELAKIEAGEMRISPEIIDVEHIVSDCLGLLAALATNAEISLIKRPPGDQPPFAIWADRSRIKQVLLNLLSNAIKYNQPGGKVTVSWAPGNEGQLRIEVADTGRGIPKEFQTGLFEPFSRLGMEYSEIEGTGIGLAITRQIVELMDGRIGFESTEGEGSSFWFDLPAICEIPTAQPESAGPENRALPPETDRLLGSALYIEDNVSNRLLMDAIFSEQLPGITLLAVSNGANGIAEAQARNPDVIFLDINLPDMSGFEVLKTLRGDAGTEGIPVIAISANAMPVDVRKGIEAGFNDYLEKPIKIPRLMEILCQYMG